MSLPKTYVEKFDGKCDFTIWKEKMTAILVQQKCHRALSGPQAFPDSFSEAERQDLMDLAYSTIILNLSDTVLRKVRGNSTAPELWMKLNELYMVKSVSKIAYLKEQLFAFKMDAMKSIDDNYD